MDTEKLHTLEEVRKAVVEEAEENYTFVDPPYNFSKIAKEEIVAEGEGVAVARFGLHLEDRGLLTTFTKKFCERHGIEIMLWMDMREKYGIAYYECVWVIPFGEGRENDADMDLKLEEENIEEQKGKEQKESISDGTKEIEEIVQDMGENTTNDDIMEEDVFGFCEDFDLEERAFA